MRNPASMLFSDYAEAVLARSLARPQTVHGYRTLLRRALPRLSSARVGKITKDHVREVLVEARADGLSDKSLANLLGAIRMVLRSAGSRAADDIRVRVPDPDVRALTAAEARSLREVLHHLPADNAILALLGTGMRLAELEHLRPQDVDYHAGTARVASRPGAATKSGKSRTVDVASYAVDAVDYVVNLYGVPPRRTLRRRLEDRCRAAGIPRIRIHDLRHTRITLLLLAGAPPLYACEQAGHHDPSYTLRVYGHLVTASEKQRRAWADAA